MCSCLFCNGVAIDPSRTISPYFLFPDRHPHLQCIDEPSAGLEPIAAMSGDEFDAHTRFADAHDTLGMLQPHCREIPASDGLVGQFPEYCGGHVGMGSIVQVFQAAVSWMRLRSGSSDEHNLRPS